MKKLLIILAVVFSVSLAYGDAEIGYIYDSRDFSMVEVVTSTSVAKDLKFWGFTDLYNQQGSKKAMELTDYFMDYRLDWNLFPIGKQYFQQNVMEVEAEYNGFSGDDNDLVRTGFSWTRNFFRGGFIQGRYFPWDSRGEKYSHASITHVIPLVKGWSFFGFYDYHMEQGAKSMWYYEPSLIYKIDDTYSFIFIYRWDDFAHDAAGEKGNGIAVGIYRRL